MSFDMDHEQFASFYGPTTGDSVRLGDTDLFAKVEKDLTVHGKVYSVVEKFFVTVWVLVLLRPVPVIQWLLI